MTTEQAQQIIDLLKFHLSFEGGWWAFGVGFGLGASLMIYKYVRHLYDGVD